MSWDRFERDEYSSCACGRGKIIKHSWQADNDWNRSESGVSGYDIECSNCKNKYHIGYIERHRSCPSWIGDGTSREEYLVPDGLDLPKVITSSYIQFYSADAEIVSKYSKDTIADVIDDMNLNKYSTRVQLRESKDIIHICNKRLHTKSTTRIIPVLFEILSKYDTSETECKE